MSAEYISLVSASIFLFCLGHIYFNLNRVTVVLPFIFRVIYIVLTLRFVFPLSGHTRESIKDSSYNGNERAPVAQRSPKTDRYQPKPAAVHMSPQSDRHHHHHHHRSDQPAAGMTSPVRDSVVISHPPCVSSPLSVSKVGVSASLTKSSTPPGVYAVSRSPTSAPVVSSCDVEPVPQQPSGPPRTSFAPSAVASSRLSSPPRAVQALRPPASLAPKLSPETPDRLPEEASSSLPAAPPKLTASLASAECRSRLAAGSSGPSVSSSPETLVRQMKSALPPTASGPSTTVSPPALVSISSYGAPITSPEKHIVHGSKVPFFIDTSGGSHEKPAPPRLIPATSSVSTTLTSPRVAPHQMFKSGSSAFPGSRLPMSASQPPSVRSNVSEPAPASWCQISTTPGFSTGLSAASAASAPPPPPGLVTSPPRATQDGRPVRPLSALPPVTTQASRTAPMSNPPALVSVAPDIKSFRAVQSSDPTQHTPNTTTPPAQMRSPPKLERHGLDENRKTAEDKRNAKPEEHFPPLDSGIIRMLQVEATEVQKAEVCSHKPLPDLPGESSQTPDNPDVNLKNTQTGPEQHCIGLVSEPDEDSAAGPASLVKRSQPKNTRLPHLSHEQRADHSPHAAFYCEDSSTFDTPSKLNASSVLEKSCPSGGDGSFLGDSSQVDTSQFDSTSGDSTRESSFSVGDSRDATLDSTRAEEASESEGMGNSCHLTGSSMLESSLNISQSEDPPVHSRGVSHPFVSPQPAPQGTFTKSVRYNV